MAEQELEMYQSLKHNTNRNNITMYRDRNNKWKVQPKNYNLKIKLHNQMIQQLILEEMELNVKQIRNYKLINRFTIKA